MRVMTLYVTLKQTYAIDFSSQILALYVEWYKEKLTH